MNKNGDIVIYTSEQSYSSFINDNIIKNKNKKVYYTDEVSLIILYLILFNRLKVKNLKILLKKNLKQIQKV